MGLKCGGFIVEGKAGVPDAPVGYGRVEEFRDAEPAELVPELPVRPCTR